MASEPPSSATATVTAATVSGAGEVVVAASPGVAIGAVLCDRYQLIAELGRGGMGTVYEAFDRVLGVLVAVKVLGDAVAGRRTWDRYRREVLLARRVSHRNVCVIHDLGVHRDDGGQVGFVTMELLRGESLAARLRRGPPAEAGAAAIARDIAAALVAAHARGVIHRDLKSANVMLVDGGARAVVTDFGIALDVDDPRVPDPADAAGEALTDQATVRGSGGAGAARAVDATGSDAAPWTRFAGTPGYMAPEQRDGLPLTTAADLHALGVVMFELVAGRMPADAGASAGSPRWDALIARCCAAEPSARPSAADVVAALAPAPRRRRRRLAWIGAAFALAAAAWSVARRPSRPPGPVAATVHTEGELRMLLEAGGPGEEIIHGLARDAAGNLYWGGHGSGDVVVAGRTLAVPADLARSHAYVASMDPRGRLRWLTPITATGPARVSDVALARDGRLIAAGAIEGTLRLGRDAVVGAGTGDAYVASFDAGTGAPRWARGLGAKGLAQVKGLAVADGDILLTGRYEGELVRTDGSTASSARGRAPFVACFGLDGRLRWRNAATVTGDDVVAEMSDLVAAGDVVIAIGATQGALELGPDATIARLPNLDELILAYRRDTGALAWWRTRDHGGDDQLIAMSAPRNGAVLIAGAARTPGREAASDVVLAALDLATHQPQWERTFAGDGIQIAAGVAWRGAGAIAVGNVRGEVELAGRRFAVGGPGGMFVVELDGRGAVAWAQIFPGNLRVRTLLVDGDRLAVAGRVEADAMLDGHALTKRGRWDGFAAELSLAAIEARARREASAAAPPP